MKLKANTPGISIIMPVYNTGYFVYEAVWSVVSLNIQIPHEVILVDDYSDDQITLTNLSKCENEFKVKLFRLSEKQGSANARNFAIQNAAYKYILNMDSDDLLNTNFELNKNGTYCDQGVQFLENNPNTAFVHCFTQMFGEYSGYTSSCFPLKEDLIAKKYHVPTWIIYRKEDAYEAGLYSNKITKWTDWSFGVALLNGRLKNNLKNHIKCFPLPFYLYRIYSSEHRISLKNISELEMVQATVELFPDIFIKYYHNTNQDQLAQEVLSHKPTNIQNLLHIANHDINLAQEYVQQRKYKLTSEIESNKTP